MSLAPRAHPLATCSSGPWPCELRLVVPNAPLMVPAVQGLRNHPQIERYTGAISRVGDTVMVALVPVESGGRDRAQGGPPGSKGGPSKRGALSHRAGRGTGSASRSRRCWGCNTNKGQKGVICLRHHLGTSSNLQREGLVSPHQSSYSFQGQPGWRMGAPSGQLSPTPSCCNASCQI